MGSVADSWVLQRARSLAECFSKQQKRFSRWQQYFAAVIVIDTTGQFRLGQVLEWARDSDSARSLLCTVNVFGQSCLPADLGKPWGGETGPAPPPQDYWRCNCSVRQCRFAQSRVCSPIDFGRFTCCECVQVALVHYCSYCVINITVGQIHAALTLPAPRSGRLVSEYLPTQVRRCFSRWLTTLPARNQPQ